MPNETVIFLHIPKTAGTTLRRILEKQYPPHEQYSTYPTALHPQASLAAFKQLDATRRLQIRLLMGHIPFGLHTFLPRPSRYFTILREPVERVVSHYYFIRRTPSHHLYQYATSAEMTLPRFVESQTTMEAKNLQTRLLSGAMNRKKPKASDEEILALAKKNLHESFAVVGLAERFDETLLLLKNAFQWRRVFYVKLNVTRSRPQQDEMAPDVRCLIQEHNQLDSDLYHYARGLFDEQIHRQGATFTEQLRVFQSRNRLLQPLLHVWWKAPHVARMLLKKASASQKLL